MKDVFIFEKILSLLLWGFFVGRLFHIALKFSYYEESLIHIFYIFDGGYFLWATFFTIILFFIFMVRRENQSIRTWLDIITPAYTWCLMCIHIGGFLSQKTPGNPTEKAWGIIIEGINIPFSGLKTHPIDMYYALITLICFVLSMIFLIKYKQRIWTGVIYITSILCYAITQIIVSPYVMVPNYTFFGNNVNRIISWGIVLTSIVLLFYIFRNSYARFSLQKTTIPHRSVYRNRH